MQIILNACIIWETARKELSEIDLFDIIPNHMRILAKESLSGLILMILNENQESLKYFSEEKQIKSIFEILEDQL